METYRDHDDSSTLGLLPLHRLRELQGQIAQLRGALEVVTEQPCFDPQFSMQLDRLVQAEEQLSEWAQSRQQLGEAA